jgi:aspartate aminotransferase
VADFILEEGKSAVVAGVSFGNDDHVRFSYATSMKSIERAMDQLEEALKKLK